MTTTAERPSTTPPETIGGTQAAPQDYHWTVDAFYRALDARVFDCPERLELIRGRIVENMGQSPLHAGLRRRIARMLRAALEPRFYVCEETPIHIAFDGEPTPDVSVMNGAEGDYDNRHPTPEDAVLLVEVAVSTMDFDLGEKAVLYAQSGIIDYWVVLPAARQIVVHRAPSESGFGDVVTLGEADVLSPLAAPDVSLSVRELFGA